jgi:hypothetical protein
MTLTKGQLVMTEHGLAWYVIFNKGFMATPIHKNDAFTCGMCYPATRAQVEAKVKDMGWEIIVKDNWVNRKNQYFIQPTADSGYRIKLDGSHYQNSFDTAPEQLAEAILVARMLNATKD